MIHTLPTLAAAIGAAIPWPVFVIAWLLLIAAPVFYADNDR